MSVPAPIRLARDYTALQDEAKNIPSIHDALIAKILSCRSREQLFALFCKDLSYRNNLLDCCPVFAAKVAYVACCFVEAHTDADVAKRLLAKMHQKSAVSYSYECEPPVLDAVAHRMETICA